LTPYAHPVATKANKPELSKRSELGSGTEVVFAVVLDPVEVVFSAVEVTGAEFEFATFVPEGGLLSVVTFAP